MAFVERIKDWGIKSVNKVYAMRYNHLSKIKAHKVLKQIETKRGSLSALLKKKADDYAVEELGWNGYAPWLYVYTAIQGRFKDGWIPDNYYHLELLPEIQGDYGKISFLKPLNNILLKIPSNEDIAYFIHGEWFDSDYRPIPKKALRKLVLAKQDLVVFKLDHSYQGKGVFLRNTESFDLGELEAKGNGTLQAYIHQHAFFKDFRSKAVANIRMTTSISKEGKPVLSGCYLRLGRVRDFYVKSESHVRVPVDLVSGELCEEGYLADWSIIDRHPDSKIKFSKKVIPQYRECVDFVRDLHTRMPMVKCIGWDIVVNTNERPTLIEWNGYGNDINFSEATQGPCFANLGWKNDRTPKVLGRHRRWFSP
ncbi:sugar-transfer associated ATP-grasp domain-containing protein [Pareuzebyella sediminis]|uniref:sugar-transfer associated ATP-grasp domain-containing protein n=1 Tax=Pareuzebyella sediminis TaxID=2607998 RepID=UPI0011EE63C1|nr:sugar-transfer associated ATP-grasp domain-containing protein [Pareuzebyella sediminis]